MSWFFGRSKKEEEEYEDDSEGEEEEGEELYSEEETEDERHHDDDPPQQQHQHNDNDARNGPLEEKMDKENEEPVADLNEQGVSIAKDDAKDDADIISAGQQEEKTDVADNTEKMVIMEDKGGEEKEVEEEMEEKQAELDDGESPLQTATEGMDATNVINDAPAADKAEQTIKSKEAANDLEKSELGATEENVLNVSEGGAVETPAAMEGDNPAEEDPSSSENMGEQPLDAENKDQVPGHFPVQELQFRDTDDDDGAVADDEAEDGDDEEDDDDDDDDEDDDLDEDEEDDDDEEEEEGAEEAEDEGEDEPTSFSEKQSLLVLAAEHDRVDILRAILDNEEEKQSLIDSGIPPLHIAVAYGSTNATQCLLRMGANPGVRPNVAEAEKELVDVDIQNMGRFDGVSAWELAFGRGEENGAESAKGKWFGGVFGGSGKAETPSDSQRSTGSRRSIKPVEIPPSKREGIRHAFTAEALRCIGSDEVNRLQELIDSGMPPTIDIGGKGLHDWAIEMGAAKCEQLLQPPKPIETEESTDAAATDAATSDTPTDATAEAQQSAEKSAVLDRAAPGDESLPHLFNRLDELESLAKALSTCLDNLAEEVSVCHGLLLMGGGATALASHVRSLKAQLERNKEELGRMHDAWENSEDELAYWMREIGDAGKDIVALARVTPTRRKSFSPPENEEEEIAQRKMLKAQIGAAEYKVHKLRASITDLSEESTRDLAEVEKRGLSGGIRLVRGLREELRDVEFQLNEAKSGEADCRMKVSLIQARLQKAKGPQAEESPAESKGDNEKLTTIAEVSAEAPAAAIEGTSGGANDSSRAGGAQYGGAVNSLVNGYKEQSDQQNGLQEKPDKEEQAETKSNLEQPERNAAAAQENQTSRSITLETPSTEKTESEKIATGDSKALLLRQPDNRGYFPLDLWQILLRIIGFGNVPASGQRSNDAGAPRVAPVMTDESTNSVHSASSTVMVV